MNAPRVSHARAHDDSRNFPSHDLQMLHRVLVDEINHAMHPMPILLNVCMYVEEDTRRRTRLRPKPTLATDVIVFPSNSLNSCKADLSMGFTSLPR